MQLLIITYYFFNVIHEKLNRILEQGWGVGRDTWHELKQNIICQTGCMTFPAYNQYATTFGEAK